MSTKSKKIKRRVTKQVRVEISSHKKLKDMAKEERKTISKFMDRMIKNYAKMFDL